MGLLKAVLGLPMAPLTGVVAIAEQIRRQAEDEFYDPGRIRAELEAIVVARRENAIAEEEADELEEQLVQRLLIARDLAREGTP
jgi:Gas vesicle protein G